MRIDSSRLRSFAGRAANFQLAVVADDGDAGGIVAAIFEAPEAVENQRHDALWADIADNSAHGCCSSKLPRRRGRMAAADSIRLAHQLIGKSAGDVLRACTEDATVSGSG